MSRQAASGSAVELPERFLDLEREIEAMYRVHEAFLRTEFSLITSGEPFEPQRPGTMKPMFEQREKLRRQRQKMDAALREWLHSSDFDRTPESRREEALRNYKFLSAAVSYSGEKGAIYAGTASAFALATDGSGAAADRILRDLFKLRPIEPISSNWGAEGTVEDRRIGLHALSKITLDKSETFVDKGLAYFTGVVRKEARRDGAKRLKKDRDRLGLRGIEEGEREYLNRSSSSINDEEISVTAVLDDSILREQVLSILREEAPPDQVELLEANLSGDYETLAAARRALQLPQSTENALRNRIKRVADRLAAEA